MHALLCSTRSRRGDTAQLCSTRPVSATWRNGRAATTAWERGDSGEAGATAAPGLLLLLHLVQAVSQRGSELEVGVSLTLSAGCGWNGTAMAVLWPWRARSVHAWWRRCSRATRAQQGIFLGRACAVRVRMCRGASKLGLAFPRLGEHGGVHRAFATAGNMAGQEGSPSVLWGGEGNRKAAQRRGEAVTG